MGREGGGEKPAGIGAPGALRQVFIIFAACWMARMISK